MAGSFDVTPQQRALSELMARSAGPSQIGKPDDPRRYLSGLPLDYEGMGRAYAGDQGMEAWQQMLAQLPAAARNKAIAAALEQQLQRGTESYDANIQREGNRMGMPHWYPTMQR